MFVCLKCHSVKHQKEKIGPTEGKERKMERKRERKKKTIVSICSVSSIISGTGTITVNKTGESFLASKAL